EGLVSFIEYLNEGKTNLHEVVFFKDQAEEIELDFAFQFTESYTENIHSFVNHVRTKDGGTHEVGAKSAFTRTFNEFAKRNQILKDKDRNIDGSDLREGLTAIISVRVPEALLEFEGQTKGRLGTTEVRSIVDRIISEKLAFYLEENGDTAKALIE